MKKILNGKLYFIFIIFSFFSCSGLFQYHIYNQDQYQGATGIIKTEDPLHIDKIDGMTLDEAIYRFNLNYTSGSHADTFYLIPGKHTFHISGGQAGVIGHTNVTRVTGSWIFSVNIEKGHEYRIRWRTLDSSRMITYIIDLTSDMEVGTLIDREIELSAEPPVQNSSTISLRSSYQAISQDEAITMLKKYDFHDAFENKTGSGIYHQYEAKILNRKNLVIEKTTGLMWQQAGSENFKKFPGAEKWIEELNEQQYAGFSDWRLPTLEEAASQIAYTKIRGLYIDQIFSDEQYSIWTGDVWSGPRRSGYSVNCQVFFKDGRLNWHDGVYAYVRAVRSMK